MQSLVTLNPKPLVELLKRKIQMESKQWVVVQKPFTLCIKIYEEREVLKFVATFIDWKGYLVHEFGWWSILEGVQNAAPCCALLAYAIFLKMEKRVSISFSPLAKP